jgi:hypothetical protein
MANRHHDDERQPGGGRRDYGRRDADDWHGGSRRAGQSGRSADWNEEDDDTDRGRGGFSDRGIEHRRYRGADSIPDEGGYEGRGGSDEDLGSRREMRGGGGSGYRSGRSRQYDDDIGYRDRPASPYRDEDEYDTRDRGSERGFPPMDPDEYGEVTRRGGEGRYERGGDRGHQGERRGFSRYRDDEVERGSAGRSRYADRDDAGPYGGGYSGSDRSSRGSERRGRGRDPDEGFGATGPGQGGQGGYGGTSDYVSRSRYGGGGRGQGDYGEDEWEEPQRRGRQRAAGGEASESGRGRSSSQGRTGSHAESQPRDAHGRFSSTRRSPGSSGGRRSPDRPSRNR